MLASCNELFTLREEFSDTTEPILKQININIEQAWHLQNNTVVKLRTRDGFKKEKFVSLLQISEKCSTEKRNYLNHS